MLSKWKNILTSVKESSNEGKAQVYYAANWCASSLFLRFQKRDRVTIIADILKSLNYSKRGRRKTNIMQSANLSYDQLNKYLDLLMRNGYVVVEGQMYKPTSRGLEFLETVENDYLKLRTRVWALVAPVRALSISEAVCILNLEIQHNRLER